MVEQLNDNLKRTDLNIRVWPINGSGVIGESSYKVGKKYCHNNSLD